jgi:hypothetical protein
MGSITPASIGAAGLVALLMVLPGDLPAQDQLAALLAAEQASSNRISDSGLVAAMRAAVHPEGILLWPGAPVVRGAENVERFINALPNRDSLRLTWQPIGIELARDSSAGVTWGVALVTSRLAPAPPQVGRYIATWRRDSGRWTTAALLILGINPVAAAMLPGGTRLTHDSIEPRGTAAPFVAADLAFARLAGESGAALAF